jgi:hypothetical protein
MQDWRIFKERFQCFLSVLNGVFVALCLAECKQNPILYDIILIRHYPLKTPGNAHNNEKCLLTPKYKS